MLDKQEIIDYNEKQEILVYKWRKLWAMSRKNQTVRRIGFGCFL